MVSADPALAEILADLSRTLDDRLVRFYQGFAKQLSRETIQLTPKTESQNQHIFGPVIAALRHEAGLPTLDSLPMLRGERELVMTLHGAIIHLGIRKYLFESPLPDNLGAHVKFYVRAFLSGALENMRRVHESEVPAAFRTKLGPGGGRPEE